MGGNLEHIISGFGLCAVNMVLHRIESYPVTPGIGYDSAPNKLCISPGICLTVTALALAKVRTVFSAILVNHEYG